MNDSQHIVQQSLLRMATGFKINHAADNAAGCFIASNLNTQIRGLKVANKNIADASSALNIAEGSLHQISSLLQRMRSLALQSANGIHSQDARSAMQGEVNNLLQEITRVKNTTEFNGINLFGTQRKIEDTEEPPVAVASYSRSITPIIEEEIETANAISNPTLSAPRMMALAAYSSPPTEPPTIETGTVELKYNQTKIVNIGTQSYTFTGTNSTPVTLSYTWNTETNELEITGSYYKITSVANQENNITFVGNSINYNTAANTTNNITFGGTSCTYNAANGSTDVVTFNGNNSVFNGKNLDSTITVNANYCNIMGTQGNNTFFINGSNNAVWTGSGNNYVEVSGSTNYIEGGSAVDEFVIREGASRNIIYGDGGSDVITDNGTNTGKLNCGAQSSSLPSSGYISFSGTNDSKTVDIFGKTYTIKSTNSRRSITYNYNSSTGMLTLNGSNFDIKAADNQTDKLTISGNYNTIDTGDLNDQIIINSGGGNTVKGGSGNDTIEVKSANNAVYGEDGDDIINIRNANNYIQDGSGANEINIYSGSSNIINEENSSDNIITNNVASTGFMNSPSHPGAVMPPSGALSILAGTSIELTLQTSLGEKTYTLTNTNAVTNGMCRYSIDADGTITFNSSGYNLSITSAENQTNKIKITGSSISYYGSAEVDEVTLAGSYNNVRAGNGNDIIYLNASNNNVYGENGNDSIYINIDNYNYTINGGADDDYIEINANNCKGVSGAAGKDIIVVNGTGNKVMGGADDDTITMAQSGNDIFGENGNDTIYINASNEGYSVSGGGGNDSLYINASNSGGVSGGDGNDYFYVNNGVENALVNGGGGVNTIEDYGVNTGTINIQNRTDRIGNSGTLVLESRQTISNITIGDKVYSIYNSSADSQSFIYAYNESTGSIDVQCDYCTITAASGQSDEIYLSGNNNTVYLGDKDDKLTIVKGSGNQILGGAGADYIVQNAANNSIKGEDGDDTIIINAQNSASYVVEGGNGADDITLNVDRLVNVNGGEGNDTIRNNGSNNTINGAGGTDTLYENGSGTVFTNIEGINAVGNSATISVNSGQTLQLTIAGRNYRITNNNASAANFKYTNNRGEVTFACNNFDIVSADSQNDNIVIEGSDNSVNCVNGTNSITIKSGSNNTINGGSGKDNIVMNSANNNIYGNGGNDTIVLNATCGAGYTVDGGDASDTITVNSSGNSSITGGNGNDTINVYGSNNADILGGNGDDIINVNGSGNTNINGGNNNDTINIFGAGNTITGGDGDDKFINKGQNNSIDGEGGDNVLTEQGTGTIYSNMNKIVLPNSNGKIFARAGEEMTYEISNRVYKITNNSSSDQYLQYNKIGDELTFTVDNFTIECNSPVQHNIKINGNDNQSLLGDMDDIVKIMGDGNTVDSSGGDDIILIQGDSNEVLGGTGNDTITIASGIQNNIDGGSGKNILIENGQDTVFTHIAEIQEVAKPFDVQVGANENESDRFSIDIGFMLPIIDMNISTGDSALSAIDDIDSMLETVLEKLSAIGSYQLRLQSAYESNTTQLENYTAAKSTIVDADIAEESLINTKQMILQNTTAALLAQANRLPSETILNLVRAL